MKIRNIGDLAIARQTTVEGLKHDVHEYTDYATTIDWDESGIKLTTSVPEIDATSIKRLAFPFTEDEFSDAIAGLQCWADYMWCEAKKEV